jgi:hypothetical protein
VDASFEIHAMSSFANSFWITRMKRVKMEELALYAAFTEREQIFEA